MSSASVAILAHVTSLPGPSPIGDLGPASMRFLELCEEIGIDGWQTLPLSPCGAGNSPYSALCSFAGNPLLIAPEPLIEQGWLLADELTPLPAAATRVDYPLATRWKNDWLEKAWQRFKRDKTAISQLEVWSHAPGQAWLDDWTLFAALRQQQDRRPWFGWPEPLRRRETTAIGKARREHAEPIAFHAFLQFVFAEQWRTLRDSARRMGVSLIGDLPYYPAHDSVDTWRHPSFFAMNRDGTIERGAGVPPDYYSDDGQLWSTPVFRWGIMQEEGYRWWRSRLELLLRRFDVVRLDHFRGYSAYWAVDGEAATARDGRWETGPGFELLEAVAERGLRLIAEDLGAIDDAVHELRERSGLAGMAVFQFFPDHGAIGSTLAGIQANTALYTGTHDNNTTRGWIEALDEGSRQRLIDCLPGTAPVDNTAAESTVRRIIESCLQSQAQLVVLPLQDWLDLPGTARMNVPGVAEGNWEWRCGAQGPNEEQREFLRHTVRAAGRGRRAEHGAGPSK